MSFYNYFAQTKPANCIWLMSLKSLLMLDSPAAHSNAKKKKKGGGGGGDPTKKKSQIFSCDQLLKKPGQLLINLQ